ncbi:MAG TPA: hypothetical protein VGX23_12975 [Actinocrinis sp.]|nr:hypothetical protein [Actinocrinis sp.]
MAESMAPWAAPGPSAPPTRPQSFGLGQGPATGTAPGTGARPPATGAPAGIRPAAPAPPAPAKPARRLGTRPIPLRPLSILEVIDAGVGSLRASPRVVHLTALAVTFGICACGAVGFFFFQHELHLAIAQSSYTTTDFFDNSVTYVGVADGTTKFGEFVTDLLFAVVFTGLAASFTAGLYASSAQRYVDGLPPDPAVARAGLRGRIGELTLLTLLVSLPRLLMLILAVSIELNSANNPEGTAGDDLTWLLLLGIPLCFLCTGLLAVAIPALMLERLNVAKALRRSRKLSQSGLWRSGWTCLFTLLMTYSPLALMFVYAWISLAGQPISGSITSVLSVLDLIVAALIALLSVPLRATASTMLYVDRRFRREGLDVRIAWARVAKETL